MKAIICLALIATCAIAFESRPQGVFLQTKSQFQSRLESIKDTKMGAMIMSLAEIHMATEGPLEDLIQALSDLIDETQSALDTENSNFATSTENHNAEVDRLNGLIAGAQSDIASTEALLHDSLYPRKAELEAAIENLEGLIADNEATTQQETEQRAADHQTWEEKDAEYDQAIEACEEALTLLNQLKNQEVSLAQVRVAQNAMKKLQNKLHVLKNNKIATFLKALTQVAQNFSNQQVLVQVISLVEGLLQNCRDGQAELRAAEEEAEDTWENSRLPALQAEHDGLVQSLADNHQQLNDTNDAIASNESFLAQRRSDLNDYTNALDAENANWDVVVSTHTTVSDRLTTELSGAHDASDLVNSAEFSDYFRGNVNH